MTNETESDFQKYHPAITELTVAHAKAHYDSGDEILSLNGKRTALSHFILMLATKAETYGPYLMNSTCARALCVHLIKEGFGPPAP
jgi:hypothetical protein